MGSDWVREMTESRGESVCVCVWGGGGLRCKFSFVKFLRIFVLRLQDRNMDRSTFNDGFYFSTSGQDHGRFHQPPPPPPPKGFHGRAERGTYYVYGKPGGRLDEQTHFNRLLQLTSRGQNSF